MADEYISQQGLSALMWIGLILSLLFVAIRTHVQYRNAGKFFPNDHWMFFATTCHIATVIVYQVAIPPMYEVQYFDYENDTPDAGFMKRASLYLRLQFAVDFLLWTTLWAVKFSLLFFFWRLFDSVRTPVRLFWWAMCGVTAATWVTLVVLQNFACDPIRNFFTLGKCASARDVYYSNLVFKFTVGTDIAGDILIMLIPFPLLPTLQIPTRKKLILASIFSLPIIPIIFAVLRLVIANAETENVDPVKFQLYSMLENSSAIVTSCLPSLRLFVVKQGSSAGRYKYGYNYNFNSAREYAPGQGDYFGNTRVQGGGGKDDIMSGTVIGESENRGEAGCDARVEAFAMDPLTGHARTRTMSVGGGRAFGDADEDAVTQGSSESQRGIIGDSKGVLVTREFSVR
ncbi:uncharacterized protein BDV14DRAFT_209697 [Aspergillus stella-maris]|uniref:uncharacterized protein n=1 Tax=Aspergillus stella-maris TaxID=1810926 RepID=UPI003CCE051D